MTVSNQYLDFLQGIFKGLGLWYLTPISTISTPRQYTGQNHDVLPCVHAFICLLFYNWLTNLFDIKKP
jgi:hypothetical protein